MADLSHVVEGESYRVSVDYPSYLASRGPDGAALSPAGAAYVGRLISLRNAGKAAASAALLDTYNETWRDPDDAVLDRAGFEARLAVSSVEVLDEPDRGTVNYADGRLVMVIGSPCRSWEARWSSWNCLDSRGSDANLPSSAWRRVVSLHVV